jgi:hypothetical protein
MLDWKQRHEDLKFPAYIAPNGPHYDEAQAVFLSDFEWRALDHLLDCAANTKTNADYYVQKEKILQVFYDNLPKGRQ